MKLKLSLLNSTFNQFTITMSNSLLEYDLQDICTFRQIIVNSNQKIQHHLLRKKGPIQLVQECDCSDFMDKVDTVFECGYDDKTTDYFSETEHQLNPTVDGFYQSQPKDNYLTHYLNQYEMNRREFTLRPPLIELKDSQNRYQNYKTPMSSRKRAQFRPVEVPVFDNVYLQSRQAGRKSKAKVQLNQRFDDENVNVNRIQYDDDFVKEDERSYIDEKQSDRWTNKVKPLLNMSMMVAQSSRKLLRTPRRANPLTSTQNKLSKSKNKSPRTDKQRKKSVQNKNINQMSLRIMKRIQLSFVANKSSQDSYLAVYKKELKERSQIIEKIMTQLQELGKTPKRGTSVKK